MPVEAPPDSAAIWLENWILSATVASFTNQHANFPAKNLLTPHRSDTWQSTGVGVDTSLVFDLGELKIPEGFSLVESNLDGGTFVRLRGSDDSAQVINPVYWDLPLYAQDEVGKILRWYLGDPTSGTLGSGRQFWGVRILPATFGSYNTEEDYYEIGVPWLGEYVPFIVEEGIRPRPRDPSTRSKAYGRAQWTDPLTPYREVEVPIGALTIEEFYVLEAKLRKQAASEAILDLHANTSTAAVKSGGCLYGYLSESPLTGTIDSPTDNSMTFRFEEADG